MDDEEDGPNQIEIDDNLTLLERVERYCTSGLSVQRLVHVREIAACAEEVGTSVTIARILPLLKAATCDPEMAVRQALAEQMVPLARVLLSDPQARAEDAAADASAAGWAADHMQAQSLTAKECVLSELVPQLMSLLSSRGVDDQGSDAQLTESASEALIELAALIDTADLGDAVLRGVLCLAHDNEVEENRIVATQLLGSLAPVLGFELCCQYVLPEIVCLADDPAFRVRKAAAMRIGSVSTVVGPELTVKRLLPVYEVLAHDEIWGVRKASVESLAEVSQVMPVDVVGPPTCCLPTLPGTAARGATEPAALPTRARTRLDATPTVLASGPAAIPSRARARARLPAAAGGVTNRRASPRAPSQRTGQLEKLMHESLADGSRWVRISACQALGPFIATLPSEDVSTALLEQFTNLANPANAAAADADVAYNCAFNFPGVAQAIGRARWAEIAEAFGTLASNIQWKVRRTLSCSLHDLAAILGPELAESELLPTFDLFIKDLDEVKVGVIQHLAAFFTCLTPATRLTYLPTLGEIRNETDNWRFRSLLASQLAEFGAAYPREAALETILPLAFSLSTDSVAEVSLPPRSATSAPLCHQRPRPSTAPEA